MFNPRRGATPRRPAREGEPVLRLIFHRLEEGLVGALLAAMTILTFVQVVLRYVFNTGLFWALEATTYMFGWLVLIGISYGVRVKSHIGIDVLTRAMPPKARRWVGLAVVAAAMLYAGMMFYGSWNYIDRMMRLGVEAEDIPIQRWVLGLALPIGFALLFLRLGEVAWAIVTGRAGGYDLADEAREAIEVFEAADHEEARR